MRSDLLVARRDELDLVAHVIKRVEQPDIAVTADAEHVRDLVLDQVLGNQIGTLHPRHCRPSHEFGAVALEWTRAHLRRKRERFNRNDTSFKPKMSAPFLHGGQRRATM